jgi:hypothetical protein
MQNSVNTAPTSATLNPQSEVERILTETELDWEVRMEDLVAQPSNLETPCAGIFRNDTDTYLGVVSKRYTIYQNKELVDTIMEAAKHFDLEIKKGGYLFDGERVYLQLELPDVYVGNSQVKRYITALNSHNGNGSLCFGATNEILNITPSGVESTRFFKIFKGLDKFRHSKNVHKTVEQAIRGMFASITSENKETLLMQKMAKLKVEDEVLREIMYKCYSVDINKTIAEMPTRTQNRVKAISDVLEGEVNKQDGSLWGLFQGVLKNTELNTPKGKTVEDNLFGITGRSINMKAYNIISDFINQE